MLNLSSVITAINSELAPKYQPGAYQWIDDTYQNAWSTEVDFYDDALTAYGDKRISKLDLTEASNRYKNFMIKMFREYREAKQIDHKKSFLESLKR